MTDTAKGRPPRHREEPAFGSIWRLNYRAGGYSMAYMAIRRSELGDRWWFLPLGLKAPHDRTGWPLIAEWVCIDEGPTSDD